MKSMNEAIECEWGIMGWTVFVSRDEVSIPLPTLPKRLIYEKGRFLVSIIRDMKCLGATSLSPKSFLR